MAGPFSVRVTVESPVRGIGGPVQTSAQFNALRYSATWSWGAQPGTALIEWVSTGTPTVLPMAAVTINFYENATKLDQVFYGFCKKQTPLISSGGNSLLMEFVDSREFLFWDVVHGSFNERDSRMVNGAWVRRYKHILPFNYDAGLVTYTDSPYNASQILDFLFGAPTVASPWFRVYHPNLNQPVYGVDVRGQKLGSAVADISARMGTVFTLLGGRWTLQWTVKGIGPLPDFPANSDSRRAGVSVSGNPSRITAVGDKNLYQVLNLNMEPDWASGWAQFYDLDILADDLFQNGVTEAPFSGIAAGTPYNNIAGDPENIIGRQLAAARARTITVNQFAQFRDAAHSDGNNFRDFRKFDNRSRMQMPAALYVKTLLFRAFKLDAGFTLHNAYGQQVPLKSMQLVDRALVEVTHDPVSGVMTQFGVDVISAGNGYCIAQGYQVGQDGFKTLHPETFDLNQWLAGQLVWQHISFQIDNSGEGDYFIIADQPIINSNDLFANLGAAGLPVFNANPVITAAPVRASLIFSAERFGFRQGIAGRDAVEDMPSLNGEFVKFNAGSAAFELPYADGETASFKAQQILNTLLNQQLEYVEGGYQVQGLNSTQLSSMIDRVSVRFDAGGMTEEVDFTNERAAGSNVFGLKTEVERDFDRRATLQPLLPGQRELKEEANEFRTLAGALRQNRNFAQLLVDTFHDLYGFDAPPTTVFIDPATVTGQAFPAGTPLWREATETLSPNAGPAVNIAQPVLVGVTIQDGARDAGPIRITSSGVDGVAMVRCKGPLALDDVVGFHDATNIADTFLVKDGKPGVGSALDAIADSSTKLIRVRMGASKVGGTLDYGDYDPLKQYKQFAIVRVQIGSSQGTWINVNPAGSLGIAPVWPEPAAIGGINTWNNITLGVQSTNVCFAGATMSQDLNASAPY